MRLVTIIIMKTYADTAANATLASAIDEYSRRTSLQKGVAKSALRGFGDEELLYELFGLVPAASSIIAAIMSASGH